jgi:hypothetical protein
LYFCLTYLNITMESSPWGANNNSCSASQIWCILRLLKVRYCDHRCLLLIDHLDQINPFRTLHSFFLIIPFNFPSSLSFRFVTKTSFVFLLCSMPTSISFSLVWLSWWCLGAQWELRSFSLCSLFQPPLTFSLVKPNVSPSTLFSNTLNLCISLNVS